MLGIQLLLEVIGAVEGRSREQCVEILKVCYHYFCKLIFCFSNSTGPLDSVAVAIILGAILCSTVFSKGSISCCKSYIYWNTDYVCWSID